MKNFFLRGTTELVGGGLSSKILRVLLYTGAIIMSLFYICVLAMSILAFAGGTNADLSCLALAAFLGVVSLFVALISLEKGKFLEALIFLQYLLLFVISNEVFISPQIYEFYYDVVSPLDGGAIYQGNVYFCFLLFIAFICILTRKKPCTLIGKIPWVIHFLYFIILNCCFPIIVPAVLEFAHTVFYALSDWN